MSITLGKPLGVCDKGKRKNNEDCIFPLSVFSVRRCRRGGERRSGKRHGVRSHACLFPNVFKKRADEYFVCQEIRAICGGLL